WARVSAERIQPFQGHGLFDLSLPLESLNSDRRTQLQPGAIVDDRLRRGDYLTIARCGGIHRVNVDRALQDCAGLHVLDLGVLPVVLNLLDVSPLTLRG